MSFFHHFLPVSAAQAVVSCDGSRCMVDPEEHFSSAPKAKKAVRLFLVGQPSSLRRSDLLAGSGKIIVILVICVTYFKRKRKHSPAIEPVTALVFDEK